MEVHEGMFKILNYHFDLRGKFYVLEEKVA